MQRKQLIGKLADLISNYILSHPVRVAIDGADAAGKTTLAVSLTSALRTKQREVLRISIDDFHLPSCIRYQQGSLSPEGFYQDSFNYPALINDVLQPLGPHGSRQYRPAAFGLQADKPKPAPLKTAPTDAILLMDGIFLLRPELLSYWDLTIHLVVDLSTSAVRGIARDADQIGDIALATTRYQQRYIPGQMLYHLRANPLDKADILIDNNDLEAPEIIRFPELTSAK